VNLSLLKVQELNHGGRQLLGLSTLAPEIDNSVFASLPAEVKVNDEDGGLQLFHGTILAGGRPRPRMCPDCLTFPAFGDSRSGGHSPPSPPQRISQKYAADESRQNDLQPEDALADDQPR